MNKFVMVVPGLILSLMVGKTAFSCGEESAWKAKATCMHNVIEKLHLTSDQQAKITALNDNAKNDMTSLVQNMKAMHAKMRLVIDTDKMDEAKLDSLIQEKKELMAKMLKAKMMLKHQIYMVFNAKQKKEFVELATKCDAAE